jgi:glycerol-3-phosphate dehydrogenase
VLDHAERDGVEGLVTIVGGKLTTFRLLAEATADAVCGKLRVDALCVTASTEISPE